MRCEEALCAQPDLPTNPDLQRTDILPRPFSLTKKKMRSAPGFRQFSAQRSQLIRRQFVDGFLQRARIDRFGQMSLEPRVTRKLHILRHAKTRQRDPLELRPRSEEHTSELQSRL